MLSVNLIKTDITKFKADAIVNAANKHLAHGGGVCGAIFNAAGSAELSKACQQIKHCNISQAVITPGFKLPAKFIIHTVGPDCRDPIQNNDREKLLAGCYINSLKLATQNDLKSVAFPSISTGIFHYNIEEAAIVALKAIKNADFQGEVTMALFSDEDVQVYTRAYHDVFQE